jgi:acyl-CoA reductase-like NAD-dependent aldehyde dehydrogenase
LIEEGFQALIKRGFMRVVYGGVKEGSYLVQHPAVDEIHMTGSDKTFEAIVFGPGEDGAMRKAGQNPKVTKRVTAELGNISPVIIVPGPWDAEDISTQAAKLGTWLSINAGFGCLTPRMIINWQQWEGRHTLNQAIGDFLSQVETRKAYYPGAIELYEKFTSEHPEALKFGQTSQGYLPWTLITDVDPENDEDICFNCEAFTSIFAETALQAQDVETYIEKAVNFANDQLWGTLVASIIVHPKSLEDPRIAAAVDRAVENLRYGTVVVNDWGVLAYMLMTTPWGGYPGQDIYDVQSGIGMVNNTLMFDNPKKSVVRAPFIQSPDPFKATSKNAPEFGSRMIDFQRSPSIPNLLRLFWAVLRS